MENGSNCNIIRDLLPLYCDKICSEESKAMIEEHLGECHECRTIMDQMLCSDTNTEIVELNQEEHGELEKAGIIKRFKKTLFWRKIWISLASIAVTVGVLAGLYTASVLIKKPVMYEKGLVKIKQDDDGTVNAYYRGNNYACVYGMEKEVSVNGKKERVAYLYYADSIWSKYMEKKNAPFTLSFTLSNSLKKGNADEEYESIGEIAAVYYLIGDYSSLLSMDDEEFSAYAQKAVLLWEKE